MYIAKNFTLTTAGLSLKRDHATVRSECLEKFVKYFGEESLLPKDMIIWRGIRTEV